jgi:hypothetical protein
MQSGIVLRGPTSKSGCVGTSMANIQTFILEPQTPELAICARWRANAFSVLKASYEQELRSLERFASDQGARDVWKRCAVLEQLFLDGCLN